MTKFFLNLETVFQSDTGEAIGLLLGLIAAAFGLWHLAKRARRITESQDDEALLFERQVLKQFAAPLPVPAKAVGNGHHVSIQSTESPSCSSESVEASLDSPKIRNPGIIPVPELNPATATALPGTTLLPPLANEIVRKLQAANLLECVDGPLRTRNSETVGTVLKLKDHRKIAVLENALRENEPDLEMIITFLDGIIMPGPGVEPLFVKRFQYFIADTLARGL